MSEAAVKPARARQLERRAHRLTQTVRPAAAASPPKGDPIRAQLHDARAELGRVERRAAVLRELIGRLERRLDKAQGT